MNKKITTKDICMLGIGIALYAVISSTIKIPLIGHIQTDLGYVVFGAYCAIMGPMAAIVGCCGCIIISMIFSGWFPIGWALGQIAIGIICGKIYNKYMIDLRRAWSPRRNIIITILWTLIAIVIGIVAIKTVVECLLYQIPFPVKVIKNLIAAIADFPPMIIGIYIGYRIRKYVVNE